MPRNKEIFQGFFNKAKEYIDAGNLDEFKKIVSQQYQETESIKESILETKGSYELGQYDEWTDYYRTKEVDKNYFTDQDYKELFSYASSKNAVPILNWLYEEQGLRYSDAGFKHFCEKNEFNQTPEVRNICELQMKYALQYNKRQPTKDHFQLVKVILEHSPIYKNNKTLTECLTAIAPLFENLKAIDNKAKTEFNSWTGQPLDSFNSLTAFSSGVRKNIEDYLTGKIDSKVFNQKVETSAQSTMAKLEVNSEGWTMVKNVLLTITLIGPLLKAIFSDDGQAYFENSTTVKVREMKDSLAKLKLPEESLPNDGENLGNDSPSPMPQ